MVLSIAHLLPENPKAEAWRYTNLRALRAVQPTATAALEAETGDDTIAYTLAPNTLYEGAWALEVPAGETLELTEIITGARGAWLADTLTITLGEGATLKHARLHTAGEGWVGTRHVHLHQGEGSHYEGFCLSTAGDVVRQSVQVQCAGKDTHTQWHSVAVLHRSQQVDNEVHLHHTHTGNTADIQQRHILSGTSQGVFKGKFYVADTAQQTDAYMLVNNLLLSDQAQAFNIPQLEIYADDVKCSHGATTGSLDENQLYYMATRGLSEAAAKHLLVQGFAQALAPSNAHAQTALTEALGHLG